MYGHLARIAEAKAHGKVAEIRIDDLYPKEQLIGADPSGRYGAVVEAVAPLASHKVGIALLGEFTEGVFSMPKG